MLKRAVLLLGIAFAAVLPGDSRAMQEQDPAARVRVLLFVRTDCPITNRYAPELKRIANEFAGRGVAFWLVYPDASETTATIEKHMAQYQFPGTAVRDPKRELVKRAHATVAPEAAVFDSAERLLYHGRIDDRYVDIGKARPEAQSHDLENAIAAVLAGRPVAQAETRA
ncbi:MAG: redoxin domain-containing protein, partial [Acidobacteriaceae bacterium]|nr:redoxin domain-containing protein [Acidobacteriaceae bacterium]